MPIGVMDFPELNDTANIKSPLSNALNSGINTYTSMANAQLANAKAQLPFGGASVPGPAGKVIGLEMIRRMYGDASPQYQSAMQAYNLGNEAVGAKINYQNAATNTMPLRYLTDQGRSFVEGSNVNQGRSPTGTPIGQPVVPGQAPYNPNLQPNAQGSVYAKARLLKTTPPAVLQKDLYATNIDKTLQMIDPDKLTQYSGYSGGIQKAYQQFLAGSNKESKNYDDYQSSRKAVEFLVSQVRQFYSDSIQPKSLDRLEDLADPSLWSNNPKLAKQLFGTTKTILKKELQTYRDATTGTGVYTGNSSSSNVTKWKRVNGQLVRAD